jgi:acyl-homoserine lactone acylase PvdQ
MFTKITIALGVATLFILAVVFMKPLAKVEAIASIQSITGLQGRATVVRDKFGVPHVTASNDRDVYFMMGYLHAQDRFFQMDVLRRQGSCAAPPDAHSPHIRLRLSNCSGPIPTA